MERRDVRGHYEELAAEYDEHWVYGPDYIPWMSARIAEALRLTTTDRIADIGCGTGLFAREVVRAVRPRHPVLCVDPSEGMLRQIGAPPPPGLTPIVAGPPVPLLLRSRAQAEGRALLGVRRAASGALHGIRPLPGL